MAGLKDYQISVYVANLGKYVEGVLQGAWITLPMPAERLQDTLKTEVGLGGRYEEYAIHDYEGGEGLLATVANPGEYESLTDLNLMCRAFEAREDDDPDVYEKVQTVRDDLDAVPRTPLQYANLALNSDEIPYHSYDAPVPPRRPDDIHGRIPTLERMGDRTDRDVVRHSRHSIVGRCGSRIPYFRCVERLQSNPLNAKEVCDVESGL